MNAIKFSFLVFCLSKYTGAHSVCFLFLWQHRIHAVNITEFHYQNIAIRSDCFDFERSKRINGILMSMLQHCYSVQRALDLEKSIWETIPYIDLGCGEHSPSLENNTKQNNISCKTVTFWQTLFLIVSLCVEHFAEIGLYVFFIWSVYTKPRNKNIAFCLRLLNQITETAPLCHSVIGHCVLIVYFSTDSEFCLTPQTAERTKTVQEKQKIGIKTTAIHSTELWWSRHRAHTDFA